ncbi:MAG: hypothetical protein SOW56_06980 [Bacteroidaceae bacterium]|nr:hypothetical protein [Bacteroidaceae bacterium]
MKKKYLMLSCIAVVAIATFVGTKTLKSNAHEENSLLAQNVEALSEEEEGETLWLRQDENCSYSFEGKAGAEVTLNIAGLEAVKLKCDANGKVTYTAKDAQTRCFAGGNEQCQARYCPVVFWESNS